VRYKPRDRCAPEDEQRRSYIPNVIFSTLLCNALGKSQIFDIINLPEAADLAFDLSETRAQSGTDIIE
jgi:hypothetical protein